jgi:hypothetical protein
MATFQETVLVSCNRNENSLSISPKSRKSIHSWTYNLSPQPSPKSRKVDSPPSQQSMQIGKDSDDESMKQQLIEVNIIMKSETNAKKQKVQTKNGFCCPPASKKSTLCEKQKGHHRQISESSQSDSILDKQVSNPFVMQTHLRYPIRRQQSNERSERIIIRVNKKPSRLYPLCNSNVFQHCRHCRQQREQRFLSDRHKQRPNPPYSPTPTPEKKTTRIQDNNINGTQNSTQKLKTRNVMTMTSSINLSQITTDRMSSLNSFESTFFIKQKQPPSSPLDVKSGKKSKPCSPPSWRKRKFKASQTRRYNFGFTFLSKLTISDLIRDY